MLRRGWCGGSPSNLHPNPNPNPNPSLNPNPNPNPNRNPNPHQVRRLSFGRDKSKPKEEGKGMTRSMSFGSKSSRKPADLVLPMGAAPLVTPPPSSSLSPKSPGGAAEPDQDGMSDLELSNYLEHLERNHEKEKEAFNREQK